MNKKTLTLGITGLTTILLILSVGIGNNSVSTQEFVLTDPQIPEPTKVTLSPTPMLPPPTPIMKFISHPVDNIGMADSMMEFDVKQPLVPTGFNVKAISSNPESGTVKMLLSDKIITPDTTRSEFFADQGIFIFIEDQSEGNVDRAKWVKSWLEQNDGEKVTVNGKPGVMHDIVSQSFEDGSILTNPARIIFWENDVIYEVKGIVDTKDLIKIAESL
ncbi:MAG TPA: hypothetical protein VLE02_03000 [Nitrosarchaeum sp.]|nr:hypothetical protein [Nitrosarchaeum sp.]